MEHKITVLNVPPIDQWINGQFTKKQLRSIKIEQLLERDSIQLNHQELANQITNKRILVTGAAGSIGSEIVRQLLKYNPSAIIACDQAETPLHELELELAGLQHNSSMIYYLADIRNCNRMEALFNEFQPQIVYHAAAYKHVPMMEMSPTEAIMTNVRGTKRMAEFAIKYNVQRFVMVSTDKAVNPTNIMGASKRLAEIFVQALSAQPGHQTKFITTRFGNVLGSNGSVINRFKDQISKGGPVTVTHPGIIRYFMTIPEATQLVLEAGSMGNGGEMIRLSGLVPGIDIEIKFTGLRPGEKLYEELLNDAENTLPTHHEKILIAKVRAQNMDVVNASFDSLFELAKDPMATMQLVAKMKEIVPEFVSNNSVYEKLDQGKTTLASVRKLA
jgi:FlaA1/EpsC-like NDP-sugar epimerase